MSEIREAIEYMGDWHRSANADDRRITSTILQVLHNKERSDCDYKEALRFIEDEIERFEIAPQINGCEMTDDWAHGLRNCCFVRACINNRISEAG